jgi:hypothetical protein
MKRCVLRAFALILIAPLLSYCSHGSGGVLPQSVQAQSERTSASTVPLATPTIPKHVLTGAYLFSSDQIHADGRPFSAFAASLSWAETYSGNGVSAAGIKTLLYTNPNRQGQGNPFYTSDESTFAHTCSGSRIYQTGSTPTRWYLMNPASADLVNLYKSYVNTQLKTEHFDAILDDEPFDWLVLSAMPCNYNATVWLSAYTAEAKAVGHPVIYNGLGNEGANGEISPSIGMNSGTAGGMGESCYGSKFGAPLRSGTFWMGMENTEIAMAQQNKLFVCYSSNLNRASTSIAARLYVYGSFLLTYNPGTSILWEYFATNSGYTVEPESKLVALSPAVPAPNAVSALRTTTGTYGRQYGACYLAGVSVGRCAVVVNSDTTSHAFPYTGYHHTLALSGGGILDGGTVSATGSAPPSSLAPVSAVIALP